MSVYSIARRCHDANRAFCLAVGETAPPPWPLAGVETHSSLQAAVRYALEHPELTPEGNHARWCERRTADGWVNGPVRDEHLKQHPCLVPYEELPRARQAQDRLFLAIVRALAPLEV